MDYARSYDLGVTWRNNWNQSIANLSAQVPIYPNSAGITIFSIPKYGYAQTCSIAIPLFDFDTYIQHCRGILNQEAQTVDNQGRIHVLNRENTTESGMEQWYAFTNLLGRGRESWATNLLCLRYRYHYWRSTTNNWTRTPLPLDLVSANNITNTPTVIGKRGKVLARDDRLLVLLPSNAANSAALSILASTAQGHFRDWEVVWEVPSGSTAEPLFDRYRLDEASGGDGVLSLFLVNGTDVEVLDLDLSGL